MTATQSSIGLFLATGILWSGAAGLPGRCFGDTDDERTVKAGRTDSKLGEMAKQEWEAKKGEIEAELASLTDHPWAGTYYHGDGLGVNARLVLAPESGFVFIWTGCLGVYDRNFGEVTLGENGNLKLSFEFDNDTPGSRGVAPELTPVPWDDRRYLIPPDKLLDFCNHVNSGREPRAKVHGRFFLRRGDEQKQVTGDPQVPEEHRPYLLAAPIVAKVTTVEESETFGRKGRRRRTPVVLDVGQTTGVLVGMRFWVVEPDSCLLCKAVVTQVAQGQSKATIEQSLSERRDPPTPSIGWELSTRAPWASGAQMRTAPTSQPRSQNQ